jgi:hypothetical protein
MVGLRTRRCSGSQTLNAEDNCSLRVAVWGAASMNKHREGLSKGPRAGRKGEAGIYVAPEVLVTEEGLLVEESRRSPLLAHNALHLPQHRGQPAAATNVMSANSAQSPWPLTGKRRDDEEVQEEGILEREAIAGPHDTTRAAAQQRTQDHQLIACANWQTNCFLPSPSASHDPQVAAWPGLAYD